jgi:hypothetical protein
MTYENARTYFNLKTYILESFFESLSKGITTGAIVSLFLKTKKV